MNSNDVNSIINNLCDKLGTTAAKLIPEMAGYQIAKFSIWLVISIIFIAIAVGFTVKLYWMHKKDREILAIYPDMIRKLDQKLKDSGILDDRAIAQWGLIEWKNTLDDVRRVRGTLQYDESTWVVTVFVAALSAIIGLPMFGIALAKIIGWHLAPHAMAFMWVIDQLGGGQ